MDGAGLGIFIVIILLILIFALTSVVMEVIVGWQLFTKAGKPGWGILIPVYNVMLMAEIGERPKWLGLTTGILTVVSYLSSNIPVDSVGLTIFSLTITFVMLGMLIYIIVGCARKYTNGVLIWLLWWLLPIISIFFIKKVAYIGAVASVSMQAPLTTASSPQPIEAENTNTPVAPQAAQPQAMQPAPQVQNSDLSQTFMPTQNSDSLVAYYLGFVGLLPFIGLPFAVAALVYANKAMAKFRENPTPGAKGHAITGRVLAIISLVLWFGLPLLLFVIGFIASSSNS